MKKIIHSVLALAAMVLSLAACTHDDAPTESVQVTFTARIPEDARSRSFGTGKDVDMLYTAIYEKTGENSYNFVHHERTAREGDGFSYSPYLTKGKTYKIAFWAMKEGEYEITPCLQAIAIPEMTSNDPEKEAFAGVSPDVTVGDASGSPIDVELKRPFAMLNFATTMTAAQKANKGKMKATVIVTNANGMATSYNAFTGKATYDPEQESITFGEAEILGNTYTHDNVNYVRLASCYVIPPADQKVTVQIHVTEDGRNIGSLTETDIPLEVNYATNLFGKIITGTKTTQVETN